jgi:predicted nucleic acid-binding protein
VPDAGCSRHGTPAQLITGWRERRYDLITSAEQLIELGDVSRSTVLRARIVPLHSNCATTCCTTC